MLSYYHHCVHDTGRSDWSIVDFVDEMLREGCIPALEPFQTRWDDKLAEWKRRAGQQPVLFVRYEDLKKDRRAVLAEIARFASIDASDALLDEAAARGAFDRMRSEEETVGAESYAGEKGAKGYFVRKGKVDSWKEEMPDDVIRRIEDTFTTGMERLGYLDAD